MGIEDINWTLFSWKSCISKLNYQADVCFFGDSITRGGDFQKYFGSMRIINLGLTGDTLKGMSRRADMIASVNPSKVFIMAGINDILSRRNPQECLRIYRELISKILLQVPDTRIFIQSVLPVNAQMSKSKVQPSQIFHFNELISAMCEELNVTYIDVYSQYACEGQLPREYTVDGVHLTQDSYNLWYEKISQYIRTE